jgi:hypothetical protein
MFGYLYKIQSDMSCLETPNMRTVRINATDYAEDVFTPIGKKEPEFKLYLDLENCGPSKRILENAESKKLFFETVDVGLSDPPSWLKGTPALVTRNNDLYYGGHALDILNTYPTPVTPATPEPEKCPFSKSSTFNHGVSIIDAFNVPKPLDVKQNEETGGVLQNPYASVTLSETSCSEDKLTDIARLQAKDIPANVNQSIIDNRKIASDLAEAVANRLTHETASSEEKLSDIAQLQEDLKTTVGREAMESRIASEELTLRMSNLARKAVADSVSIRSN